MCQLTGFFLLIFLSLHSYRDDELDRLWASLSDLCYPALEDYQAIERYLKEGRRPYLDLLRQSTATMPEALRGVCYGRLGLMQDLKLIGPHREMPIFEIHAVNVSRKTKDRCILIFGSYNRHYPDKARQLLAEIKACGYSGHVLLRIGGFPNLANGGLKICHVPYSFKVAFLREAQLMGYKQILWLDTAMHPLTDLEMIFEEIEWRGYFFTNVGMLNENCPFHLEETSQAMGVPLELHDQIPHLASAVIGLNLESRRAVQFLHDWYVETEKIYPNLNWFPEELNLAITAWRLDCKPYAWFGQIACNENEIFELFQLQQRPTLQFYLDGNR